MTWVKDSDDVCDDEALREADKDAALLWFVAMRECAKRDGDGMLSPMMVQDSLHKFPTSIKRAAVDRLVTGGLWHDAEGLAGCVECVAKPPSPRHLVIHGWADHLLSAAGKTDPVYRSRERRRKDLNSPRCLHIRQDVRERDRDLCRYCAIPTIWGTADRRSPKVGELDHIDPWGENTVANLAVACKRCNGRKKNKTLVESGMTLLAPGTTRADLAEPGGKPDPIQPTTTENLAESAPARETGTGQVGTGRTGTGTGPASDREPAHATNGHHPQEEIQT